LKRQNRSNPLNQIEALEENKPTNEIEALNQSNPLE